MNGRQLAERMGNIDERLVEEAREIPNYGRLRRRRGWRRVAALAAVLALMLGSGAVGALAFGAQPGAEAPARQETVELAKIGLTLLLPEDWAGRYEVVEETFPPYGSPMWEFCVKAVYDAGMAGEGGFSYRGTLFTVFQCADYSMSAEEFREGSLAGIGRYLFATENATYALLYATDVQFDPEDPAQQAEWSSLAQGMEELRFVLAPLAGA